MQPVLHSSTHSPSLPSPPSPNPSPQTQTVPLLRLNNKSHTDSIRSEFRGFFRHNFLTTHKMLHLSAHRKKHRTEFFHHFRKTFQRHFLKLGVKGIKLFVFVFFCDAVFGRSARNFYKRHTTHKKDDFLFKLSQKGHKMASAAC